MDNISSALFKIKWEKIQITIIRNIKKGALLKILDIKRLRNSMMVCSKFRMMVYIEHTKNLQKSD